MSNRYEAPSSSLVIDPNDFRHTSQVTVGNVWGLYWRSFVANVVVSVLVLFILGSSIDIRSPEYVQFVPSIWAGCVGFLLLIASFLMPKGPFNFVWGSKLVLPSKCWILYGLLFSIGQLLVASTNYFVAVKFDADIWFTFKALAIGPFNLLYPMVFAILALKFAKKS